MPCGIPRDYSEQAAARESREKTGRVIGPEYVGMDIDSIYRNKEQLRLILAQQGWRNIEFTVDGTGLQIFVIATK